MLLKGLFYVSRGQGGLVYFYNFAFVEGERQKGPKNSQEHFRVDHCSNIVKRITWNSGLLDATLSHKQQYWHKLYCLRLLLVWNISIFCELDISSSPTSHTPYANILKVQATDSGSCNCAKSSSFVVLCQRPLRQTKFQYKVALSKSPKCISSDTLKELKGRWQFQFDYDTDIYFKSTTVSVLSRVWCELLNTWADMACRKKIHRQSYFLIPDNIIKLFLCCYCVGRVCTKWTFTCI